MSKPYVFTLPEIDDEVPKTVLLSNTEDDSGNISNDFVPYRNLNYYNLIEEKGRGAFGVVYKAQVKGSDQIIALKVVYMKNDEMRKTALKELTALKKLNNDAYCRAFLLCYYNSYEDIYEKKLLIETEYVEGIDLDAWATYRRDSRKPLLYPLMGLMRDLCKALIYVHSKNIIHRDIKPGNILILSDNTPKLIDFGISCETTICNYGLQCCYGRDGTPIFMAPETIETGQSYFVSDVWSLGASIYKAATGTFCFDVENANEIPQVMYTVIHSVPKKLNTSNSNLNTIINKMLTKNPTDRPNLLEVLAFL